MNYVPLETEFVDYGLCAGVKNNNHEIITEPHRFIDGRQHLKDSHGICYDCKLLTYYYFNLVTELTTDEQGDLEMLLERGSI